MSSLKIQAYVRVQVAKSSPERHYFPNWNFMLKTRTILIVTCQPGISLLWSSSSYKIFNEKNIIFQIGILCRKTKKMMTSWFFWLELFDLMFRIIAGNCLIDLKLLLIFIQSLIMIYCSRMETNWSQINHSTNQNNFLLHPRFIESS